jgi:hypothetical protein
VNFFYQMFQNTVKCQIIFLFFFRIIKSLTKLSILVVESPCMMHPLLKHCYISTWFPLNFLWFACSLLRPSIHPSFDTWNIFPSQNFLVVVPLQTWSLQSFTTKLLLGNWWHSKGGVIMGTSPWIASSSEFQPRYVKNAPKLCHHSFDNIYWENGAICNLSGTFLKDRIHSSSVMKLFTKNSIWELQRRKLEICTRHEMSKTLKLMSPNLFALYRLRCHISSTFFSLLIKTEKIESSLIHRKKEYGGQMTIFILSPSVSIFNIFSKITNKFERQK